MRYAKLFKINEQTLAKINRGERAPSLRLACELARFARDLGHEEAHIGNWLPHLLESPFWPEILRLCRKKKSKEFPG